MNKHELEQSKNLILQRFNWAEKWRKPWDDKWLRWYKAFRGVVPKLPKGEEDRSNLHIPYTYSTVDTVRSKLLTTVFATRPYISFIPKDADDVETAKGMETLVDSQLGRTDAETLIKFYKLITDMLIYGSCPYEIGWKYEEKKTYRKEPKYEMGGTMLMGYSIVEDMAVVWDDPDFQPFMIDDLFSDPEGTSIDDSSWQIRRRYITEKELREKEKQGIYKVKDYDEIKAGAEKISEGKQDRLAAIGASHQEASDSDVGGRRIELLEMWQDDKVQTLCNRVAVIRGEPNPFWHSKKPFGMAKFDPLNGEFYGISLVEVIEYLQAELNTTRNQRIDASSVAINRMYKVLKTAGIEPADLVSRANGIIWVDRHEDVIEVAHTSIDPAAFTEESIIKEDIQEATATYAEARGAQSDQKRTATENAIRERAVGLRFEVKAMLFEAFGLKRLGMFYDQLNQQFVDDVRSVRIKGEDGEHQWQDMSPEDIAGRFEYMPAGTSIEPTLDTLNHRQNIMMLYDKFRDDPEIKARELKKKVFEAFGMKDSEKLFKTEEEMMQEQQEAMGQELGPMGNLGALMGQGGGVY